MTTYTPGPWWIASTDGLNLSYELGAGDHTHGVIYGKPNALLVKAAPDLLAALESLFEHCAMPHKHWGEGSNAKEADAAITAGLAAIRKAKGE